MTLKRLLPYGILFLLIGALLRATLLFRAAWDLEFTYPDIAQIFLRGLWFDMVVASFFVLPIAFYSLLLPASRQGGSMDRSIDAVLRFIFVYALLFDAVAEHLFWAEFNTRFNFIAVDYLVYTQEVIGNIIESYPIGWLLAAVGALSALITYISVRRMPLNITPTRRSQSKRLRIGFVLALCGALYAASSIQQTQFSDNAEANELSANGIYNLFYAFWNNEISYDKFYPTEGKQQAENNARALLHEENVSFESEDPADLVRIIKRPGKELRKNVIVVVMESMSGEYMGVFGNSMGLTPNLDKFAHDGLFFADTYATGTRTVRGLEAVTLSLPPTPGQSIIRRQGNENLFSLGFVFQDRGYDSKFIYGGYSYFDNMKQFFGSNGFDVVDRNDMPGDEVEFGNVWGISDEDLFARVIKEADSSFANGTPFLHVVMTTSNHRPYTYPEGRIDIPSHSGRLGGVKYADYGVGKLVEWAKSKPWFSDTVFVFVADHTAGSAGKAELDPKKYHIPLIFYAPGFIQPQRFENTASQIDTAPILLGLLNFSYKTKFYGEDLLNDHDEIPHAFISNYQKVALIKDHKLTVLTPRKMSEQYSWPDGAVIKDQDKDRVADAVTYYQSASWWREKYKRIPTLLQHNVVTN